MPFTPMYVRPGFVVLFGAKEFSPNVVNISHALETIIQVKMELVCVEA
jgi:hypothetical protein